MHRWLSSLAIVWCTAITLYLATPSLIEYFSDTRYQTLVQSPDGRTTATFIDDELHALILSDPERNAKLTFELVSGNSPAIRGSDKDGNTIFRLYEDRRNPGTGRLMLRGPDGPIYWPPIEEQSVLDAAGSADSAPEGP